MPGDLIRADSINAMLDEVVALEARVTALESGTGHGGAISIASVTPQPVQTGADVVITGSNFGFTGGDFSFTFNGVPTPAIRPGSSDTVLTCQVPDLHGLSPSGSQVTLSMSNAATTATRLITVVPAIVAVQGSVDVVFDGVTPDPLAAGAPNDFQFHLHSRASGPLTLGLVPTVALTGGGAPFPATVLTAAAQPLAGGTMALQPGETRPFLVRVTIPSGTTGTAFTVGVGASGGGITGASGALAFTVGQLGDPDTTFTLSPGASSPSGAIQGTTVSASRSGNPVINVSVDAEFTTPGTYKLTLSMPGTLGWQTAITQPSPAQFVVGQGEADPSTGKVASKTIHIGIKGSAGASSPGQLQLTVQNSASSKSRVLPFVLQATG